jgi:anaerobic magnesium-protoporphyrin IX monomethyl ester cyclase
MHIAFVFMGAESLGVEYLSATARASGHRTELYFDPAPFSGKLMLDSALPARWTDRRPALTRALERAAPDVVAFSCFTGNYRWSLDLARRVKSVLPRARILFGGVHASSVPHRVIAEDCVDALLVGEGEAVFEKFLNSVAGDEPEPVPGAWIKRGGEIISAPPLPPITDLDVLPHPDKFLFYDQAPALESHYMIMAARGCPFACTYCYKSLDAAAPPGTPPVRQRGVDHVIDELLPFRRRGGMRLVAFRDDVFGMSKSWLREFCEKYPRQIGIPYFCYTHPGAVDEEKARLLKQSGCVFTTMGIQSTDERTRRELLNRNYTNEQAARSVRALMAEGIRVSLDHIVGLPDDTPETLLEAARFYADLRPDRLLTFWLECYPGTEMLRRARAQGLLSDGDVARIEDGYSGYRYAGGTFGKSMVPVARVAHLMNFLPLLPAAVARRMARGRFWARFMPARPAVQHLLMTLNALKIRDPFFFYNLKYLFSRKKLKH